MSICVPLLTGQGSLNNAQIATVMVGHLSRSILGLHSLITTTFGKVSIDILLLNTFFGVFGDGTVPIYQFIIEMERGYGWSDFY